MIAMMMMLLQNAAASRGLERAGEAGFASAKQEVHDSHVLVSVMVIWQTIRRYFCCVLGFFCLYLTMTSY